jgi:hypothetical protein
MKLLTCIILTMFSIAGQANPVIRGTWFGYILNNDEKLATTIYITDDNSSGQISGDITISYNYKSGKTYYCQAKYSGIVDLKTYEFSMIMEEYIYYDLLPEGMKWCLGSIYGTISREMELRKFIIQATYRTKCSDEISEMILLKQE